MEQENKEVQIRDDCRVVDQDRTLAGRSRDDNRPIDQYRARAARSSDDHRAIDEENKHAKRRRIPQSSTYSMQDDELSDNDDMETEELQEQQRPADTSNGGKTVQKRQGRGRNKCKKVAKLKAGEKIKVMFYNNRALSKTFPR